MSDTLRSAMGINILFIIEVFNTNNTLSVIIIPLLSWVLTAHIVLVMYSIYKMIFYSI